MKSHAKEQVLGPHNEVIVNTLFILELEEILTDKRVLSINGQLWMSEQKLKKHIQVLGYDARTQYDELDVDKENGLLRKT
jgi:capsid portal protein